MGVLRPLWPGASIRAAVAGAIVLLGSRHSGRQQRGGDHHPEDFAHKLSLEAGSMASDGGLGYTGHNHPTVHGHL
jgi:hypothetical protein